jgi:hypothetical protein
LLTIFQTGAPRLAQDPDAGDVDSLVERGVNESDAPIVAAALAADVDYFVTGDRRLRNELAGLNPPFRALSPRELIEWHSQ